MIDWISNPIPALDPVALEKAQQHQNQLTKPPGSLGELETIAIRLHALHPDKTQLNNCHISIFAADHGIAKENVSAFPQSVTGQMIQNFSTGGAAISVLAKHHQADFEVVNVGTIDALPAMPHVLDCRISAGTKSFLTQPAMDEAQLNKALSIGKQAAERAINNQTDMFIGGEMGIANTTSASALACSLLQQPPSKIAGPGTGLSSDGVMHKATVIEQALSCHQNHIHSPLTALQYVGGFEIAALCGAYLRAAQLKLPVLVDGFITTVAALCAQRIQPEIEPWLFYAHQSAEPGHHIVLDALAAKPLLQLNMRLGEGSGAATAWPLLQMAYELHQQMATFSQAGIAEQDG